MNAPAPVPVWYRVLVGAGGLALLAAMGIDVAAMLGRHTGLPLLGSIELVQAAVLLSGAAALVVATLARTHAAVNLLLGRARPALRARVERVNDLLGAVYYLALAGGSSWIAAEQWHGFESGELIGLSYRPLRLALIAAALAIAAICLRRALVQRPR